MTNVTIVIIILLYMYSKQIIVMLVGTEAIWNAMKIGWQITSDSPNFLLLLYNRVINWYV